MKGIQMTDNNNNVCTEVLEPVGFAVDFAVKLTRKISEKSNND